MWNTLSFPLLLVYKYKKISNRQIFSFLLDMIHLNSLLSAQAVKWYVKLILRPKSTHSSVMWCTRAAILLGSSTSQSLVHPDTWTENNPWAPYFKHVLPWSIPVPQEKTILPWSIPIPQEKTITELHTSNIYCPGPSQNLNRKQSLSSMLQTSIALARIWRNQTATDSPNTHILENKAQNEHTDTHTKTHTQWFCMLSKSTSCIDTDQTILPSFWSFHLENLENWDYHELMKMKTPD